MIHVISAWAGHLADAAQRRIFTQLIGEAQSDPELAAAFDGHYFGPRRKEALHLLDLAVSRGQVRGDIDLPTVVDMLWGACYSRLLMPNLAGTLTRKFIRTLVMTTLQGIAPVAVFSTDANPHSTPGSGPVVGG
ncbi:hypothetical protein FNI11_10515 [Salmonella enterica subsp. salamae]|nr:hypothetical protein [Salmonella enterica subsp. salamae]ECJ2282599.1 hypothetical protein [Salmonella enterica subsp. salamae]